jgi:amino acid transporter
MKPSIPSDGSEGRDILLNTDSQPSGAEFEPSEPLGLQRHFGLVQATALNVTMIVGAGVFVTIPLMLKELPGPYALLGWLGAGALMVCDSLIWSELGARLPGSGGSYLYLLHSYGAERWGRLMAFLFIWQFLISGPLEIASGLIAAAQFANALSPAWEAFDKTWTFQLSRPDIDLKVTASPARGAIVLIGMGLVALLYRRVTILGRLTVAFWLGVLGVIVWILVEGGLRTRGDTTALWDYSGGTAPDLSRGLGAAMLLAMYSYLGYYNICYLGDEVRDPGRTIPRSILLSAVLVLLLFVAVHLALLGIVPWTEIPRESPEIDAYSLPADFMNRIHGPWARQLVTLLLIWSCLGSAFAGLLGYSRIPYSAARYGHFFAGLARIHPIQRIPHVSLLLVGGLTLFWCFFDLQSVITAMLTTRILAQFIAQIGGVILLRRTIPADATSFRMMLYPLPCLLALAGWLYMFLATEAKFIQLGLGTLLAGGLVFLIWSKWNRQWPFKAPPIP